ncbi:MAG: hypothetical protein ACRDWY_04215, partial [Actinomycetes bacterium]
MHQTLDFDRGLLRLPAIDDDTMVARLLAPEIRQPQVRRQDTKYEPAVRCVAAYEVRPHGRSETSPVMGAVVVTPGEVIAFPIDRDPQLPGLAQALDGSTMADRLAAAVGSTGGSAGCRAHPVRYKPGVRCVIRFDVETAAGSSVLYGKLYA